MHHALVRLKRVWRPSSIGAECTFHQLAPYIGKLKSTVAHALIQHYSREGDSVLDPFCGSGVVPFEALRVGRGCVANDISPYAVVLTRGKMNPPPSVDAALAAVEPYLKAVESRARRESSRHPIWVQRFFHPRTLSEAKLLSDLLRRDGQWFLLANLLGILHHQRPGFLSYPSSHLVPYLRTNMFPKADFSEMYQYRDVRSRLVAKIKRSYKRVVQIDPGLKRKCTCLPVEKLKVGEPCTIALTSPPYMNALDYGRDNRLRLWFCGIESFSKLDRLNPRSGDEFRSLMSRVASVLSSSLQSRARAILVVGEVRRHSSVIDTAKIVRDAFKSSGGWRFEESIKDKVPDIRRSRRDCRGTKSEWILVFKKTA